MSVVDLYNVPQTPSDMDRWASLHMIHHRLINLAIYRQHHIALPEYVIDPIDMRNPTAFLDQHQTMHNNTDSVLGLSGYDLSDVDLTDARQLSGWIWLNAQLHFQEATATGAF